MRPGTQITRRSVLAGGLLIAAGCRHKAPAPKAPAVLLDAAAIDRAQKTEELLLAAYDGALGSAAGADVVRLTAERAAHVSHLAALGRVISPAPFAPGEIDSLLSDSVETLRTAAIDAVSGPHAALFASIAASHEVMVTSE